MKSKTIEVIKEVLFYVSLMVLLIPAGLLATVVLSDYYHANKAVKFLPKPKEERRLEYYLHNDIMYISVDQFEIEFESTDSVLKFDSFDSLAFYISEKTSKEHKR